MAGPCLLLSWPGMRKEKDHKSRLMCFVTLFDCCESKQTNKPRKNESKSKTQVQFGASLLELEWNRNGTN